ncbi:MAG: tRNA (adenosine(37)-N6)-threonylcarbamoyltransferase complex ATPase subunit type 1 TsaE [Gammaproteobacteria bacterium]
MQSANRTLRLFLDDEAATIATARSLAAVLPTGGFVVALRGPLGAGKSSFARAVLQALGVSGAVPSPTYTLIEPYATERGTAYHVDLYRLREPEEVQALGLDELAADAALILVEWPERGGDGALAFDLALEFDYADSARSLSARALTTAGERVLGAWEATP